MEIVDSETEIEQDVAEVRPYTLVTSLPQLRARDMTQMTAQDVVDVTAPGLAAAAASGFYDFPALLAERTARRAEFAAGQHQDLS